MSSSSCASKTPCDKGLTEGVLPRSLHCGENFHDSKYPLPERGGSEQIFPRYHPLQSAPTRIYPSRRSDSRLLPLLILLFPALLLLLILTYQPTLTNKGKKKKQRTRGPDYPKHHLPKRARLSQTPSTTLFRSLVSCVGAGPNHLQCCRVS